MMKYVCKKTFVIDECDGDDFLTGKTFCIKAGTEFKQADTKYRAIGCPETIRLENSERWLDKGEPEC